MASNNMNLLCNGFPAYRLVESSAQSLMRLKSRHQPDCVLIQRFNQGKVCFQASSESPHNSFLYACRIEVPTGLPVLILELLSASKGHSQAHTMWSLPLALSHLRSLCLRGGKAQCLLSADLIRSGPPRYLSFDELEVNSLITHSRSNIPSCSQVLPTQEESITQNMYTRGKNIGGALIILCTTKTLWEGFMELCKCSER